MTNLWLTFSTDISTNFTESSGNIIYNLNKLYNFNGNIIDTTSNFIIYELSNNPIQGDVSLQASNWNQLSLNNNLSPFQGYWLGGINTNLPLIFTSKSQLVTAIDNLIINPIPVANNYGLIENWNVQNINDMSQLFINKTNFNSNISNWNVENVTNMLSMFFQANTFNQDISNWNVGNVTNMNFMFFQANTFNQDLNNWDVGNVTDMAGMFDGATNFNKDISNWNVGNVTNMASMFNGATNFNQDISNWDIRNVINMTDMFNGATNFNQDISNWDVRHLPEGRLNRMFRNVTFFTDKSDEITSNGTPFNYFNSQKT